MSDKLSNIVQYCAEQVNLQEKRPLFVGVTGDSGSGKSYLAGLIRESLMRHGLSCRIINHDDFLISRSDREPMKTTYYEEGEFMGKSHWEILENMFRLDEFEKSILDLKSNRCANYYPYSRETGVVSNEKVEVCPTEVLIFDSSMMLEHMDYLILVDVTQENIIKRKIERDSDIRTPEEITDMHKRVQGYYWERRGLDSANIVIDNNDFSNIHLRQ